MASTTELPTAWGPLLVTRFHGGARRGPSLQLGDAVRLTREDVGNLVKHLTAWCDELALDEVKRKVNSAPLEER